MSILTKSIFLMIKSIKHAQIIRYFTSIQVIYGLDLNMMIEKTNLINIEELKKAVFRLIAGFGFWFYNEVCGNEFSHPSQFFAFGFRLGNSGNQ